jgi:ribosomal protein S21
MDNDYDTTDIPPEVRERVEKALYSRLGKKGGKATGDRKRRRQEHYQEMSEKRWKNNRKGKGQQ